jgi:electron transfer flavoprotein beta subunit
MVPGMVAGILGYNFLNSCTELTVDGTTAKAVREIDGKRNSWYFITINSLVVRISRRKRLRIPNMRGIMTARTKP